MIEVWKSCPLLDGNYEVSNIGNVRHHSGRPRKLKRCKNGYLHLGIARKGRCSSNVSVAVLVCEAFHGPRPKGHDVDHINRVRDDNRPENLRWVTREENLLNRVPVSGERHHQSKLNRNQVLKCREVPYVRGRDLVLAQQFGVSRETVRDARLGKYWRNI